jgi:hypothetical protein
MDSPVQMDPTMVRMDISDQSLIELDCKVGKGALRAVPTIQKSRCKSKLVGTLALCPPYRSLVGNLYSFSVQSLDEDFNIFRFSRG